MIHKSNLLLRKIANEYFYYPKEICKINNGLSISNQGTIACLNIADYYFKNPDLIDNFMMKSYTNQSISNDNNLKKKIINPVFTNIKTEFDYD